MAARVVDLPQPVGPVTSTSPRGFSARSPQTSGRRSSSSVGIRSRTRRNASVMLPRWKAALTRKRPIPSDVKEKSSSFSSSKRWRCVSFVISSKTDSIAVGVESRQVLQLQFPVQAQRRRAARLKVKVRRVRAHHQPEERSCVHIVRLINFHCRFSSFDSAKGRCSRPITATTIAAQVMTAPSPVSHDSPSHSHQPKIAGGGPRFDQGDPHRYRRGTADGIFPATARNSRWVSARGW